MCQGCFLQDHTCETLLQAVFVNWFRQERRGHCKAAAWLWFGRCKIASEGVAVQAVAMRHTEGVSIGSSPSETLTIAEGIELDHGFVQAFLKSFLMVGTFI